jgi:hypothetical protein
MDRVGGLGIARLSGHIVQDLEAGSRIVSIGYIDAVNCFGAIPPYQLRALAVTTAERSKRAVIDRRSPKIDAIATSADGRDRTPAFEPAVTPANCRLFVRDRWLRRVAVVQIEGYRIGCG